MSFEKHSRPNASKLERHQSDIEEMRSQEWPYPRIRKYLDEEHDVSVSSEAIRKFCLSREIGKGGGVSAPKTAKKATRTRESITPETSQNDDIYDVFIGDSEKSKEDANPFSPTR